MQMGCANLSMLSGAPLPHVVKDRVGLMDDEVFTLYQTNQLLITLASLILCTLVN